MWGLKKFHCSKFLSDHLKIFYRADFRRGFLKHVKPSNVVSDSTNKVASFFGVTLIYQVFSLFNHQNFNKIFSLIFLLKQIPVNMPTMSLILWIKITVDY